MLTVFGYGVWGWSKFSEWFEVSELVAKGVEVMTGDGVGFGRARGAAVAMASGVGEVRTSCVVEGLGSCVVEGLGFFVLFFFVGFLWFFFFFFSLKKSSFPPLWLLDREEVVDRVGHCREWFGHIFFLMLSWWDESDGRG